MKDQKINLGSGSYKLDGYINVDIRESTNPDVVADILIKLPFGDLIIDEIRCAEFIEHFTPEESEIVLKEIWRVLKIDGVFRFGLPNGIKCSKMLADHYHEPNCELPKRTIEYLLDNIHGEKDIVYREKGDEDELNARLHKNLFSEHYLKLLLEKIGFIDIKFNQHMEEYDDWKEKYKIIGRAVK